MTPILKALLEIKKTQSFDQLASFKDSTSWKKMTAEERELLARLLIMQGAQQIAKGDQKVLESFEVASQVCPSAKIFFEQGIVFASYPENIRCVNWAYQAFHQAVQEDPHLLEAWYQGARVLLQLGIFDGESQHLIEANQKFEKVDQLLDEQHLFSRAEFYWQWGSCLFALGKSSGEPSDFYQAIAKYQLAFSYDCQEIAFLNDYGNALLDLAILLDKQEFYVEALDLFNQAVKADPESFEGWYNQASCLHRLFELTAEEEYIEIAQESFVMASQLNPDHSQLWLKWGQLEAMVGKLRRDQKKIEAALAKLEKAHQLEPDHPVILSCWGEIELFLGANQERLDLLQSSKSKIVKSLELHPENADTWYLYGSNLNELGRYFGDEEFYYQSIEKFQYGLSLARQNPLLWYGLALAHFALGELSDDLKFLEKAHRNCAKVIEFGGGILPQFWNDWGVLLLRLAELTSQASYIESAIEKFERALKQPILETDFANIDLEWLYNYGCAFDLLGDMTNNSHHFEKAVQVLTQVLKLDPNYEHARYNLALSLAHLGESLSEVEYYYQALELFYAVVEADPEDDLARMDLGVSLVNLALLIQDVHQPDRVQALYREAEPHLLQAASLGNSQAHYQLAGLYSLTKHHATAMHYLEKAHLAGTLPSVEEMMNDEWLEGLRYTPAFRQFLNQISSQQSNEDK